MSNENINANQPVFIDPFSNEDFSPVFNSIYPNNYALKSSKVVTAFKLTKDFPLPKWISSKSNVSIRIAGDDILLLVDTAGGLNGYETGSIVYENENGIIDYFDGHGYEKSYENSETGEVTRKRTNGNVSAHKLTDTDLPDWLNKDYAAIDMGDKIKLEDKRTHKPIIVIFKDDYVVYNNQKLLGMSEKDFISKYYKVNNET